MPTKNDLVHRLKIDNIQVRAVHEENEEKVITLTFASENLQSGLTNTGYKEVLHIDEDSIITDRMKDGLPFRHEHVKGTQFGIVENIRIVTKNGVKMLEGDARFSRSKMGQDMYMDIADGIRKNVSIGYYFQDGYIDDLGILHVSKYVPFEISITEEPIDISVGFYRSVQDNYTNIYNHIKGVKMPEETPTNEKTTTPPVDVKHVQTRSFDDERERTLKITEIGKTLNIKPEFIFDAIQNGSSVEQFRSIALNPTNISAPTPVAQLGLSDKEKKQYSFFRAINASITNNWDKAGFEKEVSDEVAKSLGKQARSFFVPNDILNSVQKRALGANTLSSGQHITGMMNSTLMGEAFIDVLRDKMLLPQLGSPKLSNLKSIINIPAKTESSTGTWIAEGDDIPDSKFKVSQKTLSPKIIAGYIEYTRTAVQLSNPAVEALAYDDLASALALPADLAAFAGTGANNQPFGIIHTADIPSVDGSELDYGKVLDMVAQVEQANALSDNMFWVSNAILKGKLKQIPLVPNYPSFLMKEDNTMCGYKHKVKTGLDNNTLIFGDFSQILMGEFGVLDIWVNDKISSAGSIRIYGFYSLDYLIRHKNAFVFSDDVAWNVN